MYDPQSFCVYELNAGGFCLARDAPHRLMCDPQSFCIYVLNTGGFSHCRDARHRLMCDILLFAQFWPMPGATQATEGLYILTITFLIFV